MVKTTVAFRDGYTRKVGGEHYEYEAVYAPGPRLQWHASIFRNGVRKGSVGGVRQDNRLDGERLRQEVATMIEIAIEGLQGIHE